ncbi:hypothetical protein [Ruegeria sp. THAF33]|uniref:hypothetical protein n=1 Tax=Ruegeria sp. THAF33 TaxID=2587853 RepID=UPI001268A1AC|nr:hypothetical protein [Ruegeria sp. THAF33]QFT74867.1 hypothetical protein FIU92_17655 [Ruegeria sp. THAF33]
MRFLTALVLVVCALGSTPAHSNTVIQKRIAEDNPCRGLKFDAGLFSIGIDRLQSVSVEGAAVLLTGDVVDATFTGRLACETSSAAFVRADASVRISAAATMHLDTCDVPTVSVTLSDFGGSKAGVLRAFSADIEEAVKAEIVEGLHEACVAFNID